MAEEIKEEQQVEVVDKKPEDKKAKVKKIINIILDALFISFAAFAVVAIIFRSTTNNNKDGKSINGYQLRTVETGSMAENNHIDPDTYKSYSIHTLPVNSLIRIKEISKTDEEKAQKFYEDLEVGDVVTFVYYTSINGRLGQYVYTHRLIEKTPVAGEQGGYRLILMGDAETASGGVQTVYTNPLTAEQSYSYVIGKVVWVNHPIGEVVSFLKSRNGILVLVVLPCSILFLVEIGKIFYYVYKDKKEKKEIAAMETQNQMDSNQAEIESLKAELAALKNKEQENATKVDKEVDEKEE